MKIERARELEAAVKKATGDLNSALTDAAKAGLLCDISLLPYQSFGHAATQTVITNVRVHLNDIEV